MNNWQRITPLKKGRYQSKIYCNQCDKLFQKSSKYTKMCDDCKEKNKKERMKRAKFKATMRMKKNDKKV